jgi:CRP-like cAMP-binding protein
MKSSIKVSNSNQVLCNIKMPDQRNRNAVLTFESIPEMVGIPFIFLTPRTGKYNFRKTKEDSINDYQSAGVNETYNQALKETCQNNRVLKKAFTTNPEGFNFFLTLSKLKNNSSFLSDPKIYKKVFKKNMLFLEGESSNFLYFLVSGKIKLFKLNEYGKEFILDICKEGDFIGYSGLCGDTYHAESAMALENSEVILINKNDFSQLLSSCSEIAKSFINRLSKNLADKELRMMKLAYYPARKRLAEAIVFLAKIYQNEPTIVFEREIMSSLSGLASESISRLISEFKEEGLLERDNGVIKITNLTALEAIQK